MTSSSLFAHTALRHRPCRRAPARNRGTAGQPARRWIAAPIDTRRRSTRDRVHRRWPGNRRRYVSSRTRHTRSPAARNNIQGYPGSIGKHMQESILAIDGCSCITYWRGTRTLYRIARLWGAGWKLPCKYKTDLYSALKSFGLQETEALAVPSINYRQVEIKMFYDWHKQAILFESWTSADK